MKSIKIIVGSYGHRPDGRGSVTLITKQSPPITVSDEEAERLVELGVAAIVENDLPLTAPGLGPGGAEGEPPEYSMKNKADELKALMEEFELKYEEGMTKQQMVDALDAFFDEAPDNTGDDTEDGQSEPLPNAGAQNSVVE